MLSHDRLALEAVQRLSPGQSRVQGATGPTANGAQLCDDVGQRFRPRAMH
jgi:hypothetical protein